MWKCAGTDVSAVLTFLHFKPIIQMLLGSGFNLTLKRTFEKKIKLKLLKVCKTLSCWWALWISDQIEFILLPLSVCLFSCSCPPSSLLLLSFIFHPFLISLFRLSFHFFMSSFLQCHKSSPSSVCLSVWSSLDKNNFPNRAAVWLIDHQCLWSSRICSHGEILIALSFLRSRFRCFKV